MGYYRFGKRFDTTLFAQSIVMILAMLVLLEIVVRYRHHPSPLTLYSNLDDQSSVEYDDEEDEELVGGGTSTQRSSSMIPLPRFIRSCWAWNHYIDYINFLLGFTTFVAVLYLLLGRFPAFVEVLGFVSVGIESTLPVPQCISNFRRRSTAGFSFLVLGSWVCIGSRKEGNIMHTHVILQKFFGDSFKLFYFIYTHSPLQFIICGAIQLSIDSVIVLQFILFSERVKKRLGIGQPQHGKFQSSTTTHAHYSLTRYFVVPVLDDSDST